MIDNCPECGVTVPDWRTPTHVPPGMSITRNGQRLPPREELRAYVSLHRQAARTQQRFHDARHRTWAQGVVVPTTAQLEPRDGIALVSRHSRGAAITLVRTLAEAMNREARYDFVGWPRNKRAFDEDPAYDTRAFVALRAGRAVAILISRLRAHWAWWTPGGTAATPDEVNASQRRPSVERIFVCGDWRRQGLARTLAHALATHYAIPVYDLAWGSPMTKDGLALVRALYGIGGCYIT